MNPDELRKLAEEVVLRVIGAVGKTCFTIGEAPEKWNRANGYIEETLLKVREETRREAIIECANKCDVDWPLGMPANAIEYAASRLIKESILSLQSIDIDYFKCACGETTYILEKNPNHFIGCIVHKSLLESGKEKE
jgi:hypothetical protein